MNLFRFAILLILGLPACSFNLTDAARLLPASSPIESSPAPQELPDRIIDSRTVVGNFVQFRWGDYFYGIVRTEQAGEVVFLIDGNEDCFLAQNARARLSIQYDIVDRCLPQACGHQINIIRAIATEQTSLATWRQSVTPAEIEQCRQVIESVTKQ